MTYLKIILKYTPILAIFFVGVFLINTNINFDISKLKPSKIIVSSAILLIAFYLRAYIWYKLLNRFYLNIDFQVAKYSIFHTVLTKYIPGKIWIFLSKSYIIANQGHSLKKVLGISLFYQLIAILTGLFVGSIGLCLINSSLLVKLFALFFIFISLTLFVLLAKQKKIPALQYKFIPKKLQTLQFLKTHPIIDLLALLVLQWFITGFAYWFFFNSLSHDLDFRVSFLQPLANNIGIIIFFTPGGLGSREGVMIAYLTFFGLSLKSATLVSILSRIWFLAIELLLFIISFLQKNKTINAKNSY